MPTAGALDRLVLEYLTMKGHEKAAEELRQNLGVDDTRSTGVEATTSSLDQYATGKGVSLLGTSAMPRPSPKLRENILFWGVEEGSRGVDKAFGCFLEWALQSLDSYRVELLRVAWPLFVESFLTLTRAGLDSQPFFDLWSPIFAPTHGEHLAELTRVTSKKVLNALVKESEFLKCRFSIGPVLTFSLAA